MLGAAGLGMGSEVKKGKGGGGRRDGWKEERELRTAEWGWNWKE
jgi:hypothetical protein